MTDRKHMSQAQARQGSAVRVPAYVLRPGRGAWTPEESSA